MAQSVCLVYVMGLLEACAHFRMLYMSENNCWFDTLESCLISARHFHLCDSVVLLEGGLPLAIDPWGAHILTQLCRGCCTAICWCAVCSSNKARVPPASCPGCAAVAVSQHVADTVVTALAVMLLVVSAAGSSQSACLCSLFV